MMTTKELVLKTLEQLPDDADVEEFLERLDFLRELEASIREADAGETIPHEQVMQEIARWLR
jgi:predicted transcriptional regulator